MARTKFTRLELEILEALWAHQKASIREIQEAFPEPRPAYTTIQTTVYRLEGKGRCGVCARSATPTFSNRSWPAT